MRPLHTLELGRFIAASMVLLSHFMPDVAHHAAAPGLSLFAGLVPPGPIAVEYFFVLSGFVMITAHHADFALPPRQRLGAMARFWWRRAARIYPLYWLAALIPLWFLYSSVTPAWAFQLVTLTPIRVRDLVPAAWSLRYEISFYLLFGLAMLPYVGRPLFSLWVLGLVWGCWPWAWDWLQHLIPLPRFPHPWADSVPGQIYDPHAFYFFAGILGGWLLVRFRPRPAWCAAGVLAGIAFLVWQMPLVYWGNGYGRPFEQLGGGLAFAGIMAGLAGFERLGWLRLGGWARRLGAVSYALYILHTPLLLLGWHWVGEARFGQAGLYGVFVAGLAGLYGVSWLACVVFDQPLQRILRRFPRPATIRAQAPI
jgi:exopolysaccharide production protein ExoZ